MMSAANPRPISIGGVGGSGTRVVAALFHDLGYYLGDDLNDAFDNLWFTLLFKRRSILLETELEFGRLVDLFFKRMSFPEHLSQQDAELGFMLAKIDRLQHSREWLLERAHSFSGGAPSRRENQPWGWKEPNTHIVIDRILAARPNLSYIHTVRHPIRMALSQNQNQLQNWGPIFFDRDVTIEPRLSLAYWCVAHRRILGFRQSMPQRMLLVDYDQLCADPDGQYTKIVQFSGVAADSGSLQRFKEYLWRRDNDSWHGEVDLSLFDPEDLAYVQEIGYALR
jgi:Sulfotransferase family